MKIAPTVFIALLLIPGGPALAEDKPDRPLKPGKVIQKIVIVPANKEWTPAGLTLGPRDRVTIKAVGTVCFHSGDRQSQVNPDGWGLENYTADWPEDRNACDDPIIDANHAALIAEVDGEKFLLGADAVFSGRSGLLHLGVNDCTLTGEFFNTGQFSVTIKVEKDAEPPLESEQAPEPVPEDELKKEG